MWISSHPIQVPVSHWVTSVSGWYLCSVGALTFSVTWVPSVFNFCAYTPYSRLLVHSSNYVPLLGHVVPDVFTPWAVSSTHCGSNMTCGLSVCASSAHTSWALYPQLNRAHIPDTLRFSRLQNRLLPAQGWPFSHKVWYSPLDQCGALFLRIEMFALFCFRIQLGQEEEETFGLILGLSFLGGTLPSHFPFVFKLLKLTLLISTLDLLHIFAFKYYFHFSLCFVLLLISSCWDKILNPKLRRKRFI